MPKKRQCVGRLRKKTSTELGSQPGDIQIATESVASICKLCCTPRKAEKNHHSFIRFSKLSCTMQVLIFSKIPLRSGNGPNWPIECDKLCTSWHKTGTENGPQNGALLGAWLHAGPDTKSVT